VPSHACSLGHTLELDFAIEPVSAITLLEYRRHIWFIGHLEIILTYILIAWLFWNRVLFKCRWSLAIYHITTHVFKIWD